MKTKFSEVELAVIVVDYLQSKDWDVYQEIQFGSFGGSADIVALKNNELWIIECKTSLTFVVLEQAYNWPVTYRSIAIPLSRRDNRGRDFAYKVCREFQMSALEVDINEHDVTHIIGFTKNTKTYSDKNEKKMIENLTPYHKNGIAGSTSGGTQTPYKVTMMKIREFIETNPKCTLNEIIESVGKSHYANTNSAKQGIRTALTNWETWCGHGWDNKKGSFVFFIR